MSKDSLSMTPPLTPNDEESMSQNESLDYMDFFNANSNRNFDPGPHSSHLDEFQPPSETSHSKPLLFECIGETHPTEVIRKDSYLGRCALSNLLHTGKPFTTTHNIKVAILPDVLYDRLRHYFLKIRKTVQLLEQGSRPFCNQRTAGSAKMTNFELRKEAVDILNSVSHLVASLSLEEEEFLQLIVVEIIELAKFLGPIYQLPQHITNARSPSGNKCASAAFHLFHLHLDVRWWTLSLLYQIEDIVGSNSRLFASPSLGSDGGFVKEFKLESSADSTHQCKIVFDEYMDAIAWDLLTLIERESSKSSLSELHKLPSFPCSCGWELAVSALHLTGWRHRFHGKEAFWAIVRKKLLMLLQLLKDNSLKSFWSQHYSHSLTFPPSTFKNLQMHQIWWMFTSVANLFQFGYEGQRSVFCTNQVNHESKMLRTLILMTVNRPVDSGPSEDELRLYVRCCHSLLRAWLKEKTVKHSDWIVALWDHYSKVLNSTFNTRTNTLDGFASQSNCAAALVTQIESLRRTSEMGKNETSWSLFLRILSCLVEHKESEWRYMKGRIFSKFHSKKMSELSPVGLHNTISLFLALANSTESSALCSKLCDLLYDVPQESAKKMLCVVLGMTAAAYLLVSKNCSLDPIEERLIGQVDGLLRQCASLPQGMDRREIGHGIILYCEGFQEVLEASSNFTLGQSKLFSAPLSRFLSQGSLGEQKAILRVVEAGLAKILQDCDKPQALADGNGIEILDSIRTHFLPTLKTMLRSRTPQPLLASICSSVVLGAARFRSQATGDPRMQEASALFNHILECEVIDGRLVMSFVANLAQATDGGDVLSTLKEDYDEKVVGALLSNLILYGSCDEVMAAKDALFVLPPLTEWGPDCPACPFGAFEMLLQNIAKSYHDAKVFQAKIRPHQKLTAYFRPLSNSLSALMKNPNAAHLPQALSLLGSAFVHAPDIIYAKGMSNCTLATLMSSVVLPQSIYNLQKPVGPTVADALAPVLPKVIRGLASLEFRCDPYIARCLRDIFSCYVLRYPSVAHPFLEVFGNDESPHCKGLITLLITTLDAQFIGKRNTNLIQVKQVLVLILEFLNTNPHVWLDIICEVTFSSVLELLLYVEDPHFKRTTVDLFRNILQEVDRSPLMLRKCVSDRIVRFVTSHLAWYESRVFRVLGVIAVTSENAIKEVLPNILAVIKQTETKRGSGKDQSLRNGYDSLLKNLNVEDRNKFGDLC